MLQINNKYGKILFESILWLGELYKLKLKLAGVIVVIQQEKITILLLSSGQFYNHITDYL
jgi:hypothetical protein